MDGKVDAARRLLDSGVPVDQIGARNGAAALWIAASHAQIAMATLLLDRGANVNRTTRSGRTALYIASTVSNLCLDRGRLLD